MTPQFDSTQFYESVTWLFNSVIPDLKNKLILGLKQKQKKNTI